MRAILTLLASLVLVSCASTPDSHTEYIVVWSTLSAKKLTDTYGDKYPWEAVKAADESISDGNGDVIEEVVMIDHVFAEYEYRAISPSILTSDLDDDSKDDKIFTFRALRKYRDGHASLRSGIYEGGTLLKLRYWGSQAYIVASTDISFTVTDEQFYIYDHWFIERNGFSEFLVEIDHPEQAYSCEYVDDEDLDSIAHVRDDNFALLFDELCPTEVVYLRDIFPPL